MAESFKHLQPMLAAKPETIEELASGFPWYGTPKIDGFRCVTECSSKLGQKVARPLALTRKLKPIKNYFMRGRIEALGIVGLDGELWKPGAANLGQTSSPLTKHEGMPDVHFYVFDYRERPSEPYLERVEDLEAIAAVEFPSWVHVLAPTRLDNFDELLAFEAKCLAEGHEGICLRDGDSPYKHGRSTMRERYLVKLKKFETAEAEIIGAFERMKNTNALESDERGYAKRRKTKAGREPTGLLGGIVARTPEGVEFEIGPGNSTHAQLAEYWAMHLAGKLVGELATYKFQPHGEKDKPRCGTLCGLRSRDDL